MKELKEQLTELIALAQLHLYQTHQLHERLFVDGQEYRFFREWALQQKSKTHPPAVPVVRKMGPPPAPLGEKPAMPVKKDHAPQNAVTQNGVTQNGVAESSSPEKGNASLGAVQVQTPPLKADPVPQAREGENAARPAAFLLEPPPNPKELDFNDLKKSLLECYPQFTLIDQIPVDQKAKLLAERWRDRDRTVKVLLLAFDTPPKQHALLCNICKALELYQVSSMIVEARTWEQKEGWAALLSSPELRLVVASSYQVQQLPGLLKLYREEEKQARHYFGKVPALLLPDLSIYFKEPSLKLSLWKALYAAVV